MAYADTFGHPRTFDIVKTHLKGAQCVLLVFDVTSRYSFEMCDYWARELRQAGEPERAVVAVGNKIDLVEWRQISTEEARAHFETMNPSIPYFEASAKTNEGVDEPFEAVLRVALRNMWATCPDNKDREEPKPVENVPEETGKCLVC